MTNSMHRKLRYQLILSRNNDDQRGMQPDCARGNLPYPTKSSSLRSYNQNTTIWLFGSILRYNWRNRFFSNMWFLQNHKEHWYVPFLGRKKTHQCIKFLAKTQKPCFWGIFGLFTQNENFSEKLGSLSFWPLWCWKFYYLFLRKTVD